MASVIGGYTAINIGAKGFPKLAHAKVGAGGTAPATHINRSGR
jgi:hypothetical protein